MQPYKRGGNPKSLENLTYHAGRPRTYDEPKKKRYLSVTETGWQGVQELATQLGYSGVSELLEQIGRGEISLGGQHE